ncbi:class I SAM-dependent methyltransferase [Streptomyces sp. NPDC091376]|uniref:class I SAM-dependent methyltransferase n=1 Tax=Streptomyces sp. NPDC091376 TaxID=3365994 RepID=UPI0038276A07
MTTESDTVETWNTYGNHQLTRGLELPELDRWDWGIPGTGPGIEVLGDMAGLRVLDLGSGLGRHAAHLAARGADVTAVDASPAQHQRALARYPDTPGLHLVCADAVAHLRDADPYDLVYSVGSMPYLDPDRLLPVLANGLAPGGRLLFSALHTNSDGTGPSAELMPRPEILRLPGTTEDHPVNMWVLTPQLWEDLLVQHGLRMEAVTTIDSPKPDNHVSYRLYAARHLQRVPSPTLLRSGSRDELRNALTREWLADKPSRPWILFVADRSAALLSLCRIESERAWIKRMFASVSDYAEYRALIEYYTAEGAVLEARRRRVRNALVHGNPASFAIVDSVREYATFLSGSALNLGLGSYVEGTVPATALAKRTDEFNAMQAGQDAASHWRDQLAGSAATTTPPS